MNNPHTNKTLHWSSQGLYYSQSTWHHHRLSVVRTLNQIKLNGHMRRRRKKKYNIEKEENEKEKNKERDNADMKDTNVFWF